MSHLSGNLNIVHRLPIDNDFPISHLLDPCAVLGKVDICNICAENHVILGIIQQCSDDMAVGAIHIDGYSNQVIRNLDTVRELLQDRAESQPNKFLRGGNTPEVVT